MGLTIQTHPDRFEIDDFTDHPSHREDPFVIVRACEDNAKVSLFLHTAALCDELIKAAVEAKRLLLGDNVPPALAQDLALAEADPANPYGGQAKHGEFTAKSAAEVAEGVEPAGPVFACTECDWHSVPGEYPEAGACPRCGSTVDPCQCDVAARHASPLAPPAPYSTPAIEIPADGAR